MANVNTDVLRKSVTADDYTDNPRERIWNFLVPVGNYLTGAMTPDPPTYWSQARDQALRATLFNEDFWSGAVNIFIVKGTSKAWEIDSEIPLRAKRWQELFLDMPWGPQIGMHLADFATTDNGGWFEVVRTARSPVSKIIGLVHLDSLRCTRTGDPDIPCLYTDLKGREHELEAHQVFSITDMPNPSASLYGIGTCAASRAYRSIYKMSVMERYVSEKLSGRRPLAIHFVSSVSPRQLESVMIAGEEDAARKGVLSYMGALVVPLLDASTPPEVSTVPLAELPDRFNRKEEFDIAVLNYANALGLDVQDLQPLTGTPLGTGAQSVVLDEKAKGKGLAYWAPEFVRNANELLDELTTFAFIEKDYRDQERQAGIANQRADASKKRIDAGITTPVQELQVQVDWDELPQEFLPEDVTGETLSDTEKPEQEAAAQEADEETEEMEPEEPEPEEGEETPMEKTYRTYDEMLLVDPLSEFEHSHRGQSVLTMKDNKFVMYCKYHHIGPMTMDEAEKHFSEDIVFPGLDDAITAGSKEITIAGKKYLTSEVPLKIISKYPPDTEAKQAPDDDLLSEIEQAEDESAALFRRASKKDEAE